MSFILPSDADVGKAVSRDMSRVLLFVVFGIIGAAINAGGFALLVVLGLHYVLATTAAWVVALLAGFALNRTFTFQSKAPIHHSLPKVTLVYLAQIALVASLIVAQVEWFHVAPIVAWFIASVPGVILSFLALKVFALAD